MTTDEQTLRRSRLNAALQAKLSKRIEAAAGISTIPRREPQSAEVGLSYAQERLWFLEKLVPNNPMYNIPYALRFKGTLDVDLLRMSLNEIVKRHDSLRTRFQERGGDVLQIIDPEKSLPLDFVDLQDLPETERETKAVALMEEEAKKPFDLSTSPLLRVKLLKLAEQEHLFLLTIHHIVSDGWSTGVFIREFTTLYAQLVQGKAMHLPQLPIQYPDFSVWQREWLQGEAYEKQLGYWKEQLAGDIPLLQVPTDFPRSPAPNPAGASKTVQLPKPLIESLKEVATQEGATMYMVLLAGFYTLLHRYSGQDDLSIGSPIANRNRYEVESLIGFFVNTLVMRLQLSPNWTFRELVARVKEVATGAFEHQDMPFEKLVAELQPQRLMSHSPFFQVMFVLQNAPMKKLELPNLTIEIMDTHSQSVKFDLTMSVWEEGDSGWAQLEYRTELFTEQTIEQFLNHYAVLLQAFVDQPELPIANAPLMTEEERHQLLYAWNDEAAMSSYPEALLHRLFEEQAEQKPDAVALVFGTERVTYGELNGRANRLAHLLQRHGVRPNDWVGISLPRSIDLVVGMIAILKAGGAYVPIDPTYPIDRMQYMIEDAELSLLLTDLAQASRLEAQASRLEAQNINVPLLCLDQVAADLAAQPADSVPDTGVTPQDRVYMIYTSGSTGRPKGVVIEHRNVSYLVQWCKEFFTDEERDGMLFATSINFDLSVFELFGTLCNGGKVVLVENILHLPQAPAAQEVKMICAVPSAMTELVRMNGIPRSTRTLFNGGEAFRPSLAKKLQALDHVEKIYNAYGPTEDTVISTISLVEMSDSRGPLIGYPTGGTKLYVLDADKQPVPIGVSGELYLSGEGLAREYWRRPEQTAEAFVQNPFSPGTLMYKTGDIVRYHADGQLEYIGRVDHQIKIRGFRVELGEIENALLQQPQVREAIVLAQEDQEGDKRLVAYVVPMEADANRKEVRRLLQQALRATLPTHMVPTAFVWLDSLPLMLNGKVDSKQLPAPTFDRSEMEHEHTPPRNETESKLVQLVAEVLQIERVGVHDNFFELGGHSLLGVQLISRIRSEMNVEVPVHHLFESPTVAELALVVERESMNSQQNNAPAMVARTRQARTVRK